MSKYLYDRIVNLRLFTRKLVQQSTDTTTEKDPITGDEVEKEEVTFLEQQDRMIEIKCENMLIKPNINVKFKAVQGTVVYDVIVTVINYGLIQDLLDYVYMEIDLGYRFVTGEVSLGSNLTGEEDKNAEIITISSPIFTCYQTSPNPDGETVFRGVVTGKFVTGLTRHPVYLEVNTNKGYPIMGHREETDSDGNLTSIEPVYDESKDDDGLIDQCLVPLQVFVKMLGKCILKGRYTYDPAETYDNDDGFKTELYNPAGEYLEVEVNIPDVLKNLPINVSSFSGGKITTLFALIKEANDLINKELSYVLDDTSIQFYLTWFNNKLILSSTGLPCCRQGLPKTVIRYAYSMTYQGPILKVTCPYYPTIYPGSFIQVYPGFYDASANVRTMGDVTSAALIVGEAYNESEEHIINDEEEEEPSKHYIYSVITMSVDFGTYEGNTMELLCVPVRKRYNDALEESKRCHAFMNYNDYQNEQISKWTKEDAWATLVYGKSPVPEEGAGDLQSYTYSDTAVYGAKPYALDRTLSSVSKEILGWTGYWDACSFIREKREGDPTFYYVTNVALLPNLASTEDYDNKAGIRIIKVRDANTRNNQSYPDYVALYYSQFNASTTSCTIPLCEYWPMIVALSNSLWDSGEYSDYRLAYSRSNYDPDVITLGDYIALPYAFSLGDNAESKDANSNYGDFEANAKAMAEQEVKNKDLYKISGTYALNRIIDFANTYGPIDVVGLYNIFIFLGGTFDEVIESINKLIEERDKNNEARNS